MLNIGFKNVLSKLEIKALAGSDPAFGKFNNNQYPIQIWEPQDQSKIKYLAELYNSVEIEKPLHFATNEDPLQKRLYLAPF